MSFLFLIFLTITHAAIEEPNYNFSIDTLSTFLPGQQLEKIEEKYGKADMVRREGDILTYRFYISHSRYRFPVFIQTYQGVVLDSIARLPSYFLHNTFHQSLINRWRKQDRYLREDNTAVYVWNDKDGMELTYSGSCTLTCFPLFFAAKTKSPPQTLLNYRAITQHMDWETLF